MKSPLNIMAMSAVLVLSLGCKPEPQVQEQPVPVEINATAIYLDYGTNLPWEGVQQVGLFMLNEEGTEAIGEDQNIPYQGELKSTSTVLQPTQGALTLPKDGTQVRLSAYWPWSSDRTSSPYKLFDLTDQSSAKAEMFLWYRTPALSSKKNRANLRLSSVLSQINVSIKPYADMTSGQKDGLKVRLDAIPLNGRFDLLTGTMQASGENSTDLTIANRTNLEFKAVVIPHSVAPTESIVIKVPGTDTIDPLTQVISLSDLIGTLEMNKRYNIQITVHPAEIEAKLVGISQIFITDWTDDEGLEDEI